MTPFLFDLTCRGHTTHLEIHMKSFAPEVVADSSGKFVGNGLRFATREEAELYVADLMQRWFLVTDQRVVESDEPVNYRWVDGKLEEIDAE